MRRRPAWWLNESRDAAFYQVKAEAVAIGNSEPAPLLTLIVGPSEEAREVGDTKRELAERHVIRKRFWTKLLDTARSTKLHSGVSPGLDNWVGTGAGTSGLAYNYVVTQHAARVELYIDRGDELENDQIYSRLLEERETIRQKPPDLLAELDDLARQRLVPASFTDRQV